MSADSFAETKAAAEQLPRRLGQDGRSEAVRRLREARDGRSIGMIPEWVKAWFRWKLRRRSIEAYQHEDVTWDFQLPDEQVVTGLAPLNWSITAVIKGEDGLKYPCSIKTAADGKQWMHAHLDMPPGKYTVGIDRVEGGRASHLGDVDVTVKDRWPHE